MIYLVNCRNRQLAEAVLDKLQDFHMGKDMALYIATREEAEAANMPSYLVSEFNIVYDDERFTKYSSTIDKMRQAVQDFEDGWHAAMKTMK